MVANVSKWVSGHKEGMGTKFFHPWNFWPKNCSEKRARLFFFWRSPPSTYDKDWWNPTLINSKLIWLQRDHEPYWWWNSTRIGRSWWCIWTLFGGTWWCIWTRSGGTWWCTTVRRRRDKLWSELETLRELDAKISNSTQRCNRKFNKANYCKENWTKARTVLGRDDLTLIFFGFFVDCRYEEQKQSRLWKTGKSHRSTWKSDTTW